MSVLWEVIPQNYAASWGDIPQLSGYTENVCLCLIPRISSRQFPVPQRNRLILSSPRQPWQLCKVEVYSLCSDCWPSKGEGIPAAVAFLISIWQARSVSAQKDWCDREACGQTKRWLRWTSHLYPSGPTCLQCSFVRSPLMNMARYRNNWRVNELAYAISEIYTIIEEDAVKSVAWTRDF